MWSLESWRSAAVLLKWHATQKKIYIYIICFKHFRMQCFQCVKIGWWQSFLKSRKDFCRAAVANKPNGVNLANISSTSMDLTFTFNLKGHFSPRFTLSGVPFSLLLQQTTFSRKQMLLKKVSCSTSKEEGHVLLNYDGRGQGLTVSHKFDEVWWQGACLSSLGLSCFDTQANENVTPKVTCSVTQMKGYLGKNIHSLVSNF